MNLLKLLNLIKYFLCQYLFSFYYLILLSKIYFSFYNSNLNLFYHQIL